MRLYYSPASPYARKVRATLIEKRLDDRTDAIMVNPLEDPADLQARNPLGKVPALQLDDGRVIVDSPVICAYLDRIGHGPALVPADADARLDALSREALADGIMDAAVALVMERRRPAEQRSPLWQERWAAAITRGVAACGEPPDPRAGLDIGHLALAVALGYLDFRLPDLHWQAAAPRLRDWLDDVARRPSLATTAP